MPKFNIPKIIKKKPEKTIIKEKLIKNEYSDMAREMGKSLWRKMDMDLSGATDHFGRIWDEARRRGFEPRDFGEALAFAGKKPEEARAEFSAWAKFHGVRLKPEDAERFLERSYYLALIKLKLKQRKNS